MRPARTGRFAGLALPGPEEDRAGTRAAVVGSGPNGLVAAAVLARAGLKVTVHEAAGTLGGACRSDDLLGAGTIVDRGAAAHPMGVSSPVLRALALERHGLRWLHPPVPAAHPLDRRPAVLLHRELRRTAAELGQDGRAWRLLHESVVERWDQVVESALSPLLRLPRHPVSLAGFGLRGAAPATVVARAAFRDEGSRALFAGSAAHAVVPLHHPLTAAFGVLFGAAAHARGWPVAAGGSQAVADALAADLESHGGTIRTGHRVTALDQVRPADLVLLDTGPQAAVRILGDAMPSRVRRGLSSWRYGTGVHKVDYLLDGPVPWADPRVTAAGTVHLGGTLAEVAAAEHDVARGRHPERPFVLLCQQGAADLSRAPRGRHVVYAYAHTPHGSTDTGTGARVDAQIERFAPGFRDRVLSRVETTPAGLEAWDANLVGGDVVGGSAAGLQQLLRPRPTLRPYDLGAPGVFLCSASTPPGGGVHGMAGYHAARTALASLDRSARGRGRSTAPRPPAPHTSS